MALHIFHIRRDLGWLSFFIVSKKITSFWEKLRLVFQCTWKIQYQFNASSNIWETNHPHWWQSLMSTHFSENFFHLFTFIEIWFSPDYTAASKALSTPLPYPVSLSLAVEKLSSLLLILVFRTLVFFFFFPSSLSADDHDS